MRRPTLFGEANQAYNRVTGKRNAEENAKEKLFTYASHVTVESFKVCLIPIWTDRRDLIVVASQGLETVVVDTE